MNCDTARSLIYRGVKPGSTSPRRTQLGFHLAECEACRAYYAANGPTFLLRLLEQPIPESPPPVEPAFIPQPEKPRHTPQAQRWLRPAAVVLGIVVLAWFLSYAVPAISALRSIHSDLQAMRLPTAASVRPAPSEASLAMVYAPSPAPTLQPTLAPTTQSARTSVGEEDTAPSAMPPATTLETAPTRTITPVPLGVVAPAFLPTTPPRGVAQPAATQPGSALTLLLMGVDRRPGEIGPSRTDAIMVARIDPQEGRVAMLSLPRDLVVNIPGYGYDRINAANVYGDLYPELGGGVELARQTVSNLLGIPIDYVVQVDFQGFIGAVDAIGGITLDVPTELYDPAYPTMDYGYTIAHFLPGTQEMDGATALMYARIRHADSDFRRMDRQQEVILGVARRLREQNVFEQLQSIARITSSLRDYIRTDLPDDKMVSLAWSFRDMSLDKVERYSLDENAITIGVLANDPYAEFAIPGAIEALTQQLLHGPTP